MLLLLATLSPLLPQTPAEEESPPERLRGQILTAFQKAKGVELSGRATLVDLRERRLGSSGVLAEVLFDGRLGRDLQGRLRAYSLLASNRLPEPAFWEFHSDGRSLTAVDHIGKSWERANLQGALEVWRPWATTPGMPRLDFIAPWLGWEYSPPGRLEFLPKPRKGSGTKGVSLVDGGSRTEWWLDTRKQFTRLVFIPGETLSAIAQLGSWEGKAIALEVEFQTLRLLDRNPRAGEFSPPATYHGPESASASDAPGREDDPPPPGRNL